MLFKMVYRNQYFVVEILMLQLGMLQKQWSICNVWIRIPFRDYMSMDWKPDSTYPSYLHIYVIYWNVV